MKTRIISGRIDITLEEYVVDNATSSKSLEFSNNIQCILADCTFGPTKAQNFSVALAGVDVSQFMLVSSSVS